MTGNTDFINLVMRGETKHVTKHDAIASILKHDVPIAPGFALLTTREIRRPQLSVSKDRSSAERL